MKKLYFFLICSLFLVTGLYAGETDYTKGLSIWFDTPNTLQGYAVWYEGRPDLWKGGDKPETAGNAGHNPDPAWESQSLPIGNGSLGANIMGSVEAERITFNEKRFGVAARIRRKERTIIGMSINSRLIFWMKYVRHLRKEIRKRLKC